MAICQRTRGFFHSCVSLVALCSSACISSSVSFRTISLYKYVGRDMIYSCATIFVIGYRARRTKLVRSWCQGQGFLLRFVHALMDKGDSVVASIDENGYHCGNCRNDCGRFREKRKYFIYRIKRKFVEQGLKSSNITYDVYLALNKMKYRVSTNIMAFNDSSTFSFTIH